MSIGKTASVQPIDTEIRFGIVANDLVLPARGSGFDVVDYSHIQLYIKIAGTGSFLLTPYYYSIEFSAYFPGAKRVIIENTVDVVQCDGHPDVFLRVENLIGITQIDISGRRFNRAGGVS